MSPRSDPFGWRHSLSVSSAQLSAPAITISADISDGVEPKLAETRYQRVSIIGEGGMGRVWLGWDTHLERNVAIKEPLGEATAAAQLLREARLTARLDHAGVVAIYDMYQEDDRPHFVMALVRGETLADALVRDQQSDQRSRHIRHVLEVCDAVGHAHRAGVVHRDLTPHNVVVDSAGAARVIDWGLAADLKDADSARGGGTEGFVSPEQRAAGPLDVRTDVWSLGALLHLVLYGTPPSDGPVPSGAQAELEAIVERCLAEDPNERYDSGIDVAEDLRNWFEGRRVEAYNETFRLAVWRLARRHRKPLIATALAAALIAAAIATGVWTTRREARRATNAEQKAQRKSAELLITDSRNAFATGDIWRAKKNIADALSIAPTVEARGLALRIGMAAVPTRVSTEPLPTCGNWRIESFTGPRVCHTDQQTVEAWLNGARVWRRDLDAHEVRVVGDEVHILATKRDLTVLSRHSGRIVRTDQRAGLFASRSGAARLDLARTNELGSSAARGRCEYALSATFDLKDHYDLCVKGTLWRRDSSSPIAKNVAAAAPDEQGRLWYTSNKGELTRVGGQTEIRLGRTLADLRPMPGSPYLLVRSQVGDVRLLDTRHNRWATSFPPGATAAFISSDGTVGLVRNSSLERWRFTNDAPLWRYLGTAGFAQLAWSSDSQRLAAVDGSGFVHVIEPVTGRHYNPRSISVRVAKSIAAVPGGGFRAVTMDLAGVLRITVSGNGLSSRREFPEAAAFRRIAVFTNGLSALVKYHEGIRLYGTGLPGKDILMPQTILDIEQSPDRNSAVLISEKGVWRWRPGAAPTLMDWPDRPDRGAVSAEGRLVLAQGPQLTLRSASGSIERTWEIPSRALAVAWQPGGDLIATGHKNGDVYLWRASTGALYARTRHHSGRISDVLFSPNGHMLAVASWDSTITVLTTKL